MQYDLSKDNFKVYLSEEDFDSFFEDVELVHPEALDSNTIMIIIYGKKKISRLTISAKTPLAVFHEVEDN